MAKKLTLGDKPKKVVEENILKELPDYDAMVPEPEQIVVSEYIPEYREVVFVNQRDPGCALMFHHKTKTHPMKQYTLFHGEKYTLPVEIIESLEGCGIPIYGEETMEGGEMKRPIIGYKYHFSFRSPNSKQRVA